MCALIAARLYYPTMLEIGAARTEITTYEPRLGMMGWGMLHNVVESVATPLHARAFVLHDPVTGVRVALVCCELVFVSLALRDEVCAILRSEHPDAGLDVDNVMLMATHTHSGPGGFTHYPFYNVTIPGFSGVVLRGLARKIADAVISADRDRVAAEVRYAQGEFPPELEVAFNRAVDAYNRNPDVTPVTEHERHLAIDRTMRLLRFDASDGRPIGSVNWFAVHGTSVHSDNTAIHSDNKGYAARFVEERSPAPGAAVAGFGQGAAGDVTPNFRRHPGRPFLRGKYPDDDQSARFCGRLQADQALALLERATAAAPEPARLAHVHSFVDFAQVEVDPRFAGGRSGLRTSPAEIGMAMFFGTEEGPGLPRSLLFLQRWVARARGWSRRLRPPGDPARDASQAEKITWVESGRRRVLGVRRLRRVPLPWRAHPALRMVRALDGDEPEPKPWTPSIVPIQLVVIGDVAIAAVPAEFTTVAGIRLRTSIGRALAPIGVTRVVLAGYANAYAGYVTTPEEYAEQDYEGASTHFGKWTLPAYQTEFDRLAERLLGRAPPRRAQEPRPWQFAPEELAGRRFGA
jgi:neutral ceramidase